MRIGELAAACGVTAKTLRFYEQADLLPVPARTGGGHRDHPPEATNRPAFIRDAQSAGLTLAEIRSVLTLRDSGQSSQPTSVRVRAPRRVPASSSAAQQEGGNGVTLPTEEQPLRIAEWGALFTEHPAAAHRRAAGPGAGSSR
ncbi:MerR family DNA-binding transcriptional regulator [Streptomyces sp. NPDC050803]|uniref:MerR family DNA-binding transcriptional regulator n=1 Tax=unclassified Streptomyces TaxID=2593676 RepID=UPI00342A78B1